MYTVKKTFLQNNKFAKIARMIRYKHLVGKKLKIENYLYLIVN